MKGGLLAVILMVSGLIFSQSAYATDIVGGSCPVAEGQGNCAKTVGCPAKSEAARDQSYGPYPCLSSKDIEDWWLEQDFTITQKNFLTNDFYQQKIIGELWTKNVKPALQSMSAQVSGAMYQSTGMIGSMMDGQAAVQTQLSMQTLEAEAYRDYTPGENLCRFGTLARSLSASDLQAEATLAHLAKIAEDRLVNKKGGHTSDTLGDDSQTRFKRFQRVYCDPGDNNGLMKNICYPSSDSPTGAPNRYNKDIDIVRTLDQPLTLNMKLDDGVLTADEEDILSLSNNLYGQNTLDNLAPALLKEGLKNSNKTLYLDFRQLTAMRNVAQYSFNAIAAQKAAGTQGSDLFMTNVLRELGLSDTEAMRYLSNDTKNPSYYAQMEVLTKKIYQNPNFYTNLMDKPANVKRQLAAMKGIELTQNRDLFHSLERQEILMSLLLELEVRAEQLRQDNASE